MYPSLSLNSERNGIIILASKQRLLWRIAPEMFKAAPERLCFQAQTYMYTVDVPDQFITSIIILLLTSSIIGSFRKGADYIAVKDFLH